MIKNHKNILYILIGVIIVFFGYWYFVLSKQETKTANGTSLVARNGTQQGTSQTNQKAYDKEFVASLQAIQYIDLDTSILQDAAYKALSFPERAFQVDYNIPVGRRNPFLPIGTGDDSRNDLIPEPVLSEQPQATSTATTTKNVLPTPKKR